MDNSEPNTRCLQALIVYISLLLDNILLTVIVPILPDYLSQIDNTLTLPSTVFYKTFDLHYVPTILTGKHPLTGNSLINFTVQTNSVDENMTIYGQWADTTIKDDRTYRLGQENGSIGMLLAVKAIVQFFVTPIVGYWTSKFGDRILIVFGTICLFITSLAFAIGKSYYSILLARALQGLASACISVCGLSLVAQLYPEDDRRSKVMGTVLGSIALGVLLGYPFGGIMYDFIGKSAPFYIISIVVFFTILMQFGLLDLRYGRTEPIAPSESNEKYYNLLSDRMILTIAGAILVSTSAMAILEPCLPIWLMENLNPKKWQIGTVFIPDSIGYFLGTNFFGTIAYEVGRLKISILSLFLVGTSSLLIPTAKSVLGLVVPHFCLGLGIGILDAALIPLLASLIDLRSIDETQEESSNFNHPISNYGSVYAIQQMSVSLAYSLGPILGGEIAQYIGFTWLMTIIGLINISYACTMSYGVYRTKFQGVSKFGTNGIDFGENKGLDEGNEYKRFYNSVDLP